MRKIITEEWLLDSEFEWRKLQHIDETGIVAQNLELIYLARLGLQSEQVGLESRLEEIELLKARIKQLEATIRSAYLNTDPKQRDSILAQALAFKS